MATSNRRFVRVPADGNGKRIAAKTVLYLDYSSATQEFYKNATVVGGTSAVRATILDVHVFTPTTGQLLLEPEDAYFDSVFTIGENLIVDSQVFAQAVNQGDEVYYNEVVLVSGDNPAHRQVVNERGAQYTTFTDGSPRLDAFGRLKVAYPTVIGTYDLFYPSSLSKFSRMSSSGAGITYLPSQSAALFSVDSTSGSYVRMTSNKYHTYLPGVGMTIMQTVVNGDAGKSGNIRRWGYFDDTNGVFWELSGSVLNVVLRSSANGSVEETRIPQAQWSDDRMDGSESAFSNLSTIALDVTKNNIYVIDFQWLGAGRIHYSIVGGDGELVLVHEIKSANVLPVPWMGEASLPIRYENINTSATAGTSELKMVCATVQVDIPHYDDNLPRENYGITGPTKLITSSAEFSHYFAGRAGKYREGKPNRTLTTITSAKVFTTGPVVLEVVKNPTLTDPTWFNPYTDTTSEFDLVASSNTGGTVVYTTIVNGSEELDIDRFFEGYRGENLKTQAELSQDSRAYAIRARLLSGSTPVELTVAANWREYR